MRRRGIIRIGVLAIGALVAAYLGACLVLSGLNPDRIHRSRTHAAGLPMPEPLPRGFLLGTATAAHQVEGGNTRNDWSLFEQEPGRIAQGDRSGRASDEWNRVPQDIKLMQDVGANAYRFSIEWSRLEPQQGVWDDAAWAHYQDEIRGLRAAGIEPMVTLLHFTLPEWLAAQGGVRAPEFPSRFGRFAAEAARRLGPQVRLWCTLNEPNVQMTLGYLDGRWPPGERSPEHAVEAFVGLLRAHAAAAGELHRLVPGAQVGVAVNMIIADPASRWSLLDWASSYAVRKAFDWSFYDAIVSGRARLSVPGIPSVDEPIEGLTGSADFYGVNYYTRFLFHFSSGFPPAFERTSGSDNVSDLTWSIYPDGLTRVLEDVWSRYHLPIYITENGIADATGSRRGAYIQSHLEAVAEAARKGIPVRGYFYWSLVDNFEWAEGFRTRFGLYHVDYPTEERTLAPGADVFRAWATSLAESSSR
jgi:beta-glucosidase